MSDTVKTVLISIGTSLVVSLFTFILGLRAGKNQADRQKLQELYKKLYAHFNDLKVSIQDDKCRTWNCYDNINRDGKIIYTPTVRKMELSGDLLFLKKRIADKTKALEIKIMQFGRDNENAVKSIHEVIISNLQLFKQGYLFAEYPHNKGRKNHFKTANPLECKSFRERSYRDLCSEEKFRSILCQWGTQTEYSIEFRGKGNPVDYLFNLYPGSLSVSIDDFVETLAKEFKEKVPGYTEYESRKKRLLKDIDKVIKHLRRRTREPNNFWETVFGAFVDIFR